MKKIIQALRNASFVAVLIILPISFINAADIGPINEYDSIFLYNALENKINFSNFRNRVNDSEETFIEIYIDNLANKQKKVENLISKRENEFSLFGWFFDLL